MFVTKQIQNTMSKKKQKLHQRSIFREMLNTCDKLCNSFLTKQQLKILDKKQKQEKNVQRRTSILINQQNSHIKNFLLQSNVDNDFFVKQSKQIKQIKDLREKLLPKVNKTNIQKKIKQIKYITNMGFTSKDKRFQKFKSMTVQKDQQNIINKSWINFYKQKNQIKPSLSVKRMKKNSYFFQKNKNIKNDQKIDMQKTMQNSQLQSRQSRFTQTPNSCNISTINRTYQEQLEQSKCKFQGKQLKQIIKQKILSQDMQKINNVKFRIAFKNNFKICNSQSQSPIHRYQNQISEQRKPFIQKIDLNIDRLQKQNTHQLYNLIKGGYSLDRNDVEGQYISLKRFRQAQQNFITLKDCIQKIKQKKKTIKDPMINLSDHSFKSVVHLSENQNKIPVTIFKKLQQINKIVD